MIRHYPRTVSWGALTVCLAVAELLKGVIS
jgi:hypothetical protein